MASNQVPVYSNKVVSSRECYISKIVLGSASILTSLAIIGVGAGLVAVYPIELATLDIIYAFPTASKVCMMSFGKTWCPWYFLFAQIACRPFRPLW